MKKINKILSILLAFVMVFAFVSPLAKAAGEEEAKTKSVTLHKLLMSKEELAQWNEKGPEGYNGTQDLGQFNKLVEGKELKEIKDVYFAWQFKNKTGEWKYIKANKEKNSPDLQGKELQETDSVDEAFGGLTEQNGIKFNTENLPQDKATEYRIVEVTEKTTYKGNGGEELAGSKAVPVVITLPLVNENGVVEDAHVYPKNTEEKPEIDKNFAKNHGLTEVLPKNDTLNSGADYKNYQKDKATVTAELGKKVPYEVKTKINKGSRYANLAWKDTMSNGLTFNTNDGVKVETRPNLNLENDKDYKLTSDDRGFTLKLTESGFKKLNEKTHPEDKEKQLGVDVEFTLTYSATVNKNAIVDVPETNDIKLEYGNKPKNEVQPTPVRPSNGELKVTKTWAEKPAPKDVQVVYTLSNSEISASVMLDGSQAGKTFDLGNGITFEVDKNDAYTGTFKGLSEEGKEWKLSERVAGYNEDIKAGEAGSATIKNTKDKENPTPLNPTEPKVVYYGKRFVKADYSTGARLQGAEFVVKKEVEGQFKYLALKDIDTAKSEGQKLASAKKAYEEAIAAWNKAVQENAGKDDNSIEVEINGETKTGKTQVQEKIKELKDAYDKAFAKAANAYEWVQSKDSENVVKLISDNQGKFEITGLEAGTYKLEETKAPVGYATKSDEEFKVGEKTYESHADGVKYESDKSVNDEKDSNEAQRVNNKKVSIPQTGGIGTLIFTVIGLSVMAVAVYVLVKNNKKDEIA